MMKRTKQEKRVLIVVILVAAMMLSMCFAVMLSSGK